MNSSFQWRSPRRSVNRGPLVFRTGDRLPIDEEGYSVFCLGDTVIGFARSYACGSARNDASRYGLVLQDPTADVDVVRRKIVAKE